MNIQQFKKIHISNKPGVYFFLGRPKGLGLKSSILYIGKATSLRDRVKSYFRKDPEGKNTFYGASLINTRGPLIVQMVQEVTSIKWQETDSVLEALILEANLIKKHQPKYNTKEKDNKSFNYVCITKPVRRKGGEELPKVLIVRGRTLEKEKYQSIFGPFPNGSQLKEAMKIIRRIFPYIDNDSSKKNNKEFYKQLGLVPIINSTSPRNPFQKVLGSPRPILLEARPDHFEKHFSASLREYQNNIRNIKLFFQGKKKSVILNLKKEMAAFSKLKDFENAGRIRDQIFALNHINDVALIKEDIIYENTPPSYFRIEAYDIAHMSGKDMVGVMVVLEDGEVKKEEYKKFIIRTQSGGNDTGALEEVLSRRLRHTEWGLPALIVVDGGTAQKNVVGRVLKNFEKSLASQEKHFLVALTHIPVVGVVKDDKHKAKAIIGDENIIKKYKKEILLANSESHRFAIAFHKNRRNKSFLNKK